MFLDVLKFFFILFNIHCYLFYSEFFESAPRL